MDCPPDCIASRQESRRRCRGVVELVQCLSSPLGGGVPNVIGQSVASGLAREPALRKCGKADGDGLHHLDGCRRHSQPLGSSEWATVLRGSGRPLKPNQPLSWRHSLPRALQSLQTARPAPEPRSGPGSNRRAPPDPGSKFRSGVSLGEFGNCTGHVLQLLLGELGVDGQGEDLLSRPFGLR
jgi:hypothetical protein